MAEAKQKTGHTPTDRRAAVNATMTEQAETRPAPPRETRIRVRALRTGYYEHVRRREGDVFDLVPLEGTRVERVPGNPKAVLGRDRRPRLEKIRFTLTPDEQFSPDWMEEVSLRTPTSVTTSQDEIRRQHDELLQTRRPASGRDAAGQELEELAPGAGDGGQGKATGDQDPLGADN